MERSTFILSITLLFLFFLVGLLFTQNMAMQARLGMAEELSSEAKSLVKLQGYKGCVGPISDFEKIRLCLLDLKQKIIEKDNRQFEKGDVKFENVNIRLNQTGFIALTNNGIKDLDSEKFTLLKNRVIVYKHCVIKGIIAPGYVCRLNFDTYCDKGDVLEVQYEEKTAYIHTC